MKVRKLEVGMRVSFFGTEYTISEVVDYDIIKVVQKNGIKTTLWFPALPGREILTTKNKVL